MLVGQSNGKEVASLLTNRPIFYTFACITAVTFAPMRSALAWGDEGHKTIALIAEHYLTPATKAQVDALLAADTLNTLTEHDIASEATWPDKYWEHGGAAKTSLWRYADIEVSTGDVAAVCFKFPNLSKGQLASDGPAKDCVIDKIDEFEAELVNAATPPAEKVLALKYLLHFVGDVHQPLHSARSKAAKRSDISNSLIAAALRAALIDGYISAELTATPSRNSTVA